MMLLSGPLWAGVGNVDNRKYVNWDTEPYNKFVRFESWLGTCTGQYVAPNIILTAAHCFRDSSEEFYIVRSDDKKAAVTLLKDGWAGFTDRSVCKRSDDWAIFLVGDPAFYNNFFGFQPIFNQNVETGVISGGFGALRILSKDEIQKIITVIKNNYESFKNIGVANFGSQLETLIAAEPYNITETLFGDVKRFKAESCKVKLDLNFTYSDSDYPAQQMLTSTCDIWGGNSGGAVIDSNNYNVYGVAHCAVVAAPEAFDHKEYGDATFVSTHQFQSELQEIIKLNPPKNSPTEQDEQKHDEIPREKLELLEPWKPIPTPQDIEFLEEKLQTQEDELQQIIPEIKARLDQGLLLPFLGKLAEHKETSDRLEQLKKAYEEAKAREQSFSNRALTAATVAATGLGGMQLAEGIAEQNADREAEEDMRAYIATMKCEYGKGQQVEMGTQDVTLPGGNELLNLYTEYKQIAERLKTTKAALGLRPGIESEVLYDKAQTGLYQYANTGKTGGGYTSLYNALTDETSDDAAAWASQKEISAQKVKAGAAVGGVGAIGGAAGNLLINKDLYFGNQSE